MSTLQQQAQATVEALRRAHLVAAAAESCTGGLIAATITGVPGASSVFRYGWVTYCNEAKERMLGVPAELIERYTVVSEPVAAAMAEGALHASGADVAVAVTGNAGPTAAEGEPPVGTVCIALARRGASTHAETLFRPDLERNPLRQLVCLRALQLLQSAALPR